MAKKISHQQEKAILKIWNSQSPFYILLCIAIVAFVLILASAEHPKYWIEKDIVVSDVSKVYIHRGSYYQITDANGATYSIESSNENAPKLVCGESYHIIYANIHWNRIKYMTDSSTVYVDYDSSIDDYYTRTIIGWIGILVSAVTMFIMIRKSLRKIQAIRGKRWRTRQGMVLL